MLIRTLPAVLLAALLAGCTFGATSALTPVRDGATARAAAGRTQIEPAPPPRSSAAEAAARPGPPGAALAAELSADDGASPAPTRDDGGRDPPADWPEAVVLPPGLDAVRPRGPRSAAVVALVASARAAAAARRYGRAAAALERALKVEPRNPRLWHGLAVIRFRQGRHAEADALALRSRSLTIGDPDLDARNRRLAAAARQRLGDEEGARAALRRARGR